MIQIQSRDLMILRTCYEQQFLTFDHLQHFFQTHRSEYYRRIKELEEAGFIAKQHSPVTGRSTLIRLTELGLQFIQEKFSLQTKPLKTLNAATLIHDTLVTSTRLRLTQFWDAEFVPERAIKTRDFPEVPDGIFFFKSGNGIAIEIENSDKGRTRFLRLVSRWKQTPKIVFVLYIASQDRLFRTLNSYLKDAPGDQPMGTLLWDELKRGKPSIHTIRGPMDLLSKREF